MIYGSQKKELRKYRHIIAALIAQSEGYFTPLYALEAIKAYKKKESFGCEWYYHIADVWFGGQCQDFCVIRNVDLTPFFQRKIFRVP